MIWRLPSAVVGVLGTVAAGLSPVGALGQDSAPLFRGHDEVIATLAADFRQLEADRRASPDRPGTLTVSGPGGVTVDVPVEVRTRGEFRLDPSNCSFPPLRFDVDGDAAVGTLFAGQDDLKLVSSCRPGRPSHDHLVHLEYLAYRAYGVLTDRSFRVRPMRITLLDTSGANETVTRFAFVIEEDEALAARLGATVFDLEEGKNLPSTAFDPTSTLMTAIFEYMIGNPDWSAIAGHNVEILERGGTAVAVPYDFDFSGLVDAPYASADPDFGLRSVRERYYRGWCTNEMTSGLVLQRFRDSREEVLSLFETYEGLAADPRGRAIRYLEEFFDDIETNERAERRFLRDCRSTVER